MSTPYDQDGNPTPTSTPHDESPSSESPSSESSHPSSQSSDNLSTTMAPSSDPPASKTPLPDSVRSWSFVVASATSAIQVFEDDPSKDNANAALVAIQNSDNSAPKDEGVQSIKDKWKDFQDSLGGAVSKGTADALHHVSEGAGKVLDSIGKGLGGLGGGSGGTGGGGKGGGGKGGGGSSEGGGEGGGEGGDGNEEGDENKDDDDDDDNKTTDSQTTTDEKTTSETSSTSTSTSSASTSTGSSSTSRSSSMVMSCLAPPKRSPYSIRKTTSNPADRTTEPTAPSTSNEGSAGPKAIPARTSQSSAKATSTEITPPLLYGADQGKGTNYCQDKQGNRYSIAPRPTSGKEYQPCEFHGSVTPIPFKKDRSKSTMLTDSKGTAWFCPSATPIDLRIATDWGCGPTSISQSIVPSVVSAYSSKLAASSASVASASSASAASAAAASASAKVEGVLGFFFNMEYGEMPYSTWAMWSLKPDEKVNVCKSSSNQSLRDGQEDHIRPINVPFPANMKIKNFKIGDLSFSGCKHQGAKKGPGTLQCSGYKDIQCVADEGERINCKGEYFVPKMRCDIKAGDKK